MASLGPRMWRRARRAGVTAAVASLVVVAPAGPGGAVSTAAGANLLTGDTATFGHSTGTWSAQSASLTRVGAPADADPGALAVTARSTSGVAAWSAAVTDTATGGSCGAGTVRVAAGSTDTATASVQATAVGQSAETVIAYCSGATLVDVAWGPATSAPVGSWQKLAPAVGVAPSSATTMALGVLWAPPAAGGLLYVDDAVVTAWGPAPASVRGPLEVVGNTIRDGAGNPVVLRGVDLFGLQASSGAAAATAAQVAQIRAWGTTLVRISVSDVLWLSGSCAYDPTYRQKVESVVQDVTSLGMVALLDLHVSQPQDFGLSPGAPCLPAGEVPMPGQDALTFWRQAAGDLAGNPLVAFDLYNEPNGVSDSQWLQGGTASAWGSSYQAVGMQALYDAVRGAGASNLVVVSGTNWAAGVPSVLVAGSNIAYSVHAYTCSQSPPPNCSNPSPLDPTPILSPWVPLSASVPVMVGEFGWPDDHQGAYTANVVGFAEAHGWSWDLFAWDGTTYGGWNVATTGAASGPEEPAPVAMPSVCAFAATALAWAQGPCPTPPPTAGTVAASTGTGGTGTGSTTTTGPASTPTPTSVTPPGTSTTLRRAGRLGAAAWVSGHVAPAALALGPGKTVPTASPGRALWEAGAGWLALLGAGLAGVAGLRWRRRTARP